MFSTEATTTAIGWVRSLYLSIHRDPQHYTDRDLEQIISEGAQLRLTAEAELLRRRATKEG